MSYLYLIIRDGSIIIVLTVSVPTLSPTKDAVRSTLKDNFGCKNPEAVLSFDVAGQMFDAKVLFHDHCIEENGMSVVF